LGLAQQTAEHLVFDGLLRIAEQRGLLASAPAATQRRG
jgi:hypothetical protein